MRWFAASATGTHELLKDKTPEERTAFYEKKAKTAMERAKQAIDALPEDATLDEIMEKVRHLEAEPIAESGADPVHPLPEGRLWEFLEHAAGSIDMPSDWASEHDHYLYGAPKRSSAA